MSRHRVIPLEHVAEPLRRRLLETLAATDDASVDELAEATGAHANTIRSHAGALVRDGVLARVARATGRRGRPRVRYRLAAGWRLPGRDLRGLAELLAGALAGLEERAIDDLGRAWGRAHADTGIAPVLHTLGFRAAVKDDEVRLSDCPCRLVLPDRPELVCRLATAVVDGITGDRVRSATHDPQARRCTLRLAG